MHSHHRLAAEYFAEHDDRLLDNESNINRCSPNLNCHTIVGMPSPLVQVREMSTTATDSEREREKNRINEKHSP